MEPLIQDIIIDLTESQNVVAFANQYDNNSRIIRCHIQNKGEKYPLESHILNLRCKKSNQNGIYKLIGKDGFGSVSGNIIEIPVIKEMTISSGRQVCDIEIYDGEHLLYTCTFYLRVAPSALSNEEIKDSDDYEDVHYLFEQERDRAMEAENNLDAIKVDKTTVASDSILGLIKSGTDITVDESGNVSVNDNSHNHIVSNISDLTATADELNILDGITATTAELNYVNGSTANIQEQLNNKSNNDHLHDDRYYTQTETDIKLNTKLDTALRGTANGIAELDAKGFVPSSQLPSFVDDVIEGYLDDNGSFFTDAGHTTEIAGESGKIYIDLLTNKTYRWSGSVFVVISETLALGETSTTAYRGDRGKIAYDHSQTAHAPSDAAANQNAFSSILVDDTAIAADSETDALALASGDNITITPDAANKKITLSSSHPSITQSGDSTSEASPSAGETFTAIDSVMRDENGHITNVNTKTVTLPSTSIDAADLLNMVYPIGSIYMSVNNVSPGSFLGGTWETWGAGRVPVGVNTDDTDFSTVEQTGGNKNLQSHTHTIAHTHTLEHTHSIPDHTHSLNSHKHSIPSLSGTAASAGTHHHSAYVRSEIFATGTSGKQTLGSASDYTGSWNTATIDNGAHTHTVTTTASTTGAATGNTGGLTVDELKSGSASTSTTSAPSTANTGSSGSGNTGNLQPYITCYMWKRVA